MRGPEVRVQPVLAVLAVSFVLGLGVRKWNLYTFVGVGVAALLASAVLYRLGSYM